MGPNEEDDDDSAFSKVMRELVDDLYSTYKVVDLDEFLTKDEDKITDFGIF